MLLIKECAILTDQSEVADGCGNEVADDYRIERFIY